MVVVVVVIAVVVVVVVVVVVTMVVFYCFCCRCYFTSSDLFLSNYAHSCGIAEWWTFAAEERESNSNSTTPSVFPSGWTGHGVIAQ